MLTTQELVDCRGKLDQARNTVEAVRLIYLQAAYTPGVRLLNDIAGLISDEIAALDKAIAAKP